METGRGECCNPSPASVSDQVHQTSYPYEEAFKQDTGAIHKKALPEFTMPFPHIFRVLFGLRHLVQTGDARSEISEADGSDPPVIGPGSGAGRSLVFTAPPRP